MNGASDVLKTPQQFLARLHDGVPKLLSVPDHVGLLRDWLGDAVDIWLIDGAGGDRNGIMVLPAGCAAGSGAPVDAGTPPMACFALLLPEGRLAARLRRWWRESGDVEAPVVAIDDGRPEEALPRLFRFLARRTRELATAAAAAQRALVRTRQDYEQTRQVFDELMTTLSLRPPEPPVLACEVPPAETSQAVSPIDAMLTVSQPLPVQCHGIVALAVHLAGRSEVEDGRLRLRLLAKESGRILGSWSRTGRLAPGWQRFELPQPVLGIHETALLEVWSAGSSLPLALGAPDALIDGLAVAGRGDEGRPLGRPLAFRVWTAAPGSRFVRPDGFVWQEADRLVAWPAPVPALAWDLLARANVLEGAGLVHPDPEAQRLLAAVPPGRQIVLSVPDIDPGTADLLIVDLRTVVPSDSELLVGARVVPAVCDTTRLSSPAGEDDNSLAHHWRAAHARGTLCIVEPLPAGAQRCDVILAAERRGGEPALPAVVEWLAIRFAGAFDRPAPPPAATEGSDEARPQPCDEPTEALAEGGGMRLAAALPSAVPLLCERVWLIEVRRLPSGYEHLGLGVVDLRCGGRRWRQLQTKFAFSRRGPALEFRPDGDGPFMRWPEGETDRHGPLFRIDLAASAAAEREARLATLAPADRELVNALVASLPELVGEALAGTGPDAGVDAQLWLQRAAACRDALSGGRGRQAA